MKNRKSIWIISILLVIIGMTLAPAPSDTEIPAQRLAGNALFSMEGWFGVALFLVLYGFIEGIRNQIFPIVNTIIAGIFANVVYWAMLATQGEQAVIVAGWILVMQLPILVLASIAGAVVGQAFRWILKLDRS